MHCVCRDACDTRRDFHVDADFRELALDRVAYALGQAGQQAGSGFDDTDGEPFARQVLETVFPEPSDNVVHVRCQFDAGCTPTDDDDRKHGVAVVVCVDPVQLSREFLVEYLVHGAVPYGPGYDADLAVFSGHPLSMDGVVFRR